MSTLLQKTTSVTLLFSLLGAVLFSLPFSVAGATVVEVSGDTSAGENQPGWLFNRDASTATPFEFNTDEASIGDGSLYVLPIGGDASDKFIGENFINSAIADINSISYDFMIGSGGSDTDANHFYMNVYANFGESDDDKYYDCRYDIVPTTGSTTSFTTVTFDPTQSYPVTTRGGASASPYTCPSSPADMDNFSASSTIRVFALNVGDTSTNDVGLDGYLDNVVVDSVGGVEISDFEPFVATAVITSPLNGSTQSGIVSFTAEYNDLDGDDAVQWAVRAGTCESGTGAVYGNVGGNNTAFSWDGESFSSTIDMTNDTPGNYCFVFNPTEDSGDENLRVVSEFVLEAVVVAPIDPENKNECKKGGYEDFGFKNQGQCIRFVETGKDSR